MDNSLPDSLVGLVFMIPIRPDLVADDHYSTRVGGTAQAMLDVAGVRSVSDAMGARPYHIVEFELARSELKDPLEIERAIIRARDSVPADGLWCGNCQKLTTHRETEYDYQCKTCGWYLYGGGYQEATL